MSARTSRPRTRTQQNPLPFGHVQAILYRHVDDDSFRIHTFGGREGKIIRDATLGEVLQLSTLPRRTEIEMRAIGHAVVLSHARGWSLTDEF